MPTHRRLLSDRVLAKAAGWLNSIDCASIFALAAAFTNASVLLLLYCGFFPFFLLSAFYVRFL